MYNVMIVDDEPVIRFGLKASVDWEKEGLFFLGAYPNGEEAFEIMKENHVDILITDIKMPVMDGLTLMRKAVGLYPKIKVILVSSFNEFEYVKEGIKYGAVDYVLKPTLEQEEFVQLIEKCVKLLKEETYIEKKLTLVDQSTSLLERKKVEQNLKRILLNEKDFSDYGEINYLNSGSILVIYMKMNDIAKIEEQCGVLFKSFTLEEIQERFYNQYEEGVCLIIGEVDILFFVNIDLDPVRVLHQLQEVVMQESNVRFSFGYDMISSVYEAKEGFRRSFLACERRFFYPEEAVFSYKELKESSIKRSIADEMKQFVIPVDKEKVVTFIEERYYQWKQEEFQAAVIRKEASDILSSLFGNKLDLSLLIAKCHELQQTETLDDLYISLIENIDECIQLISEQKRKPSSDNELMERAISYIHQHYTEELTLQKVADHIHISRNYFSILFKQYSDQKFIDYVINLRINKASELLLNTTLKVYEVAQQSGFKDVKYFSKLFKRMTGHSPIDYRLKQEK
ncbi:response regulator transcription factor [Halalkalibacter alkaliphilus]|uniref:Response regulator n=1 Tax=Halalkalibacter alkaliphilus TaxID=2917993 RepID=A0A9X2A691_9BACI|nr:response regulator [Halalkalibacter alkaliphilus]MCL7746176.1 response regulator [Halalkalibacter alkaliphilus]